MLYQNTSCTSTGTPRKNQTYAPHTDRSTGLCDMRPTATSTPSRMPITIATTVSSMVVAMPSPMICAVK